MEGIDLDAALDPADAERVRARLVAMVARHPWTAQASLGRADSTSARLRVSLEREGLRATLAVVGEAKRPLEALAPWAHGTPRADDLESTLGAALGLLARMAALDAGGYPALCAQALAPEPALDPMAHFQLRAMAIRRLGEGGYPGALHPLTQLLQREDDRMGPRLAGHAVGALVSLGDPAGVLPLIAWAQRKDAAVVSQVAFAVAELGGPVAEAYLVTLGSGHPDAGVRRAAADALSAWGAR